MATPTGTVVGTFSVSWPHSVVWYRQAGILRPDAGAWSASGTFTVDLATGQVIDSTVTLRPVDAVAREVSGPISLTDVADSFVRCGVYDGLGGVDTRRYPQLPQTRYTDAPTVSAHEVQRPSDVCGPSQPPALDESVSLDYSSLHEGDSGQPQFEVDVGEQVGVRECMDIRVDDRPHYKATAAASEDRMNREVDRWAVR